MKIHPVVLLLGSTLLISVRASALEIPAQSRFFYQTPQGLKKDYIVQVTARDVIANGVRLSAAKKNSVTERISEILQVEPHHSAFEACDTGTFVHEVRTKAKSAVESGCIDSRRFTALSESFEALAH